MLMLQRAAENVNPSECNDPAVLLACSLGSDSCPAACVNKSNTDNEEDNRTPSNISDMPVAGDLTIAVADYSSSVKSAPAVGTVIFNAVDFKASEKVTIESVKLERIGLSSKSDIKGVWFEKDGVAVSAKASLSSDGTVTTRFYNNYSVSSTDTLDLVAELSGSAGSEIAFKIIDAVTTAKNVSLNTETTTYRTTNYNVARINFVKKGTAASYKIGEKKTYEIGKFQLSNENSSSEDKDIVIKSLKLRNSGNWDIATLLKNVYVTKDSKTVSKRVDIESKDLIIYFDDDVLASGKRGLYTIYAEVAQLDRVGDDVQLELRKNSELVANEISTNFRVAYASEMEKTPANLVLAKYTFNGGKTTFANAKDYAKTVEAAASSTDVEIANGTLTVAESIKLEGLTIGASLTTYDSTTVINNATRKVKDTEWTTQTITANNDNANAARKAVVSDHIKDLKVEIGGSTYNAKVVDCSWKYPVKDAADDTDTAIAGSDVCYQVTDEMYVSKTSDVKVLVNLSTNEYKDTITFTNLRGSSFAKVGEYDESGSKLYAADIAGSVQVAKLTVKPGKFNITNKTSSNQKAVVNSTDEVTIFDGEISTSKGNVSISSLTLTDTTPAKSGNPAAYKMDDSDQITLTLYVDWEAFADEILNNKKVVDDKYFVEFANLGDLSSSSSMKIKIVAQPNVSKAGWEFTFKVQAKGTDSSSNDVESSSTNTAKLSITNSASATIANSSAKSEVVRDGSNAQLLSFTATVKDGSYNLQTVDLAFTDTVSANNLSNVTLEIDWRSIDTVDLANPVHFVTNETLSAGKHTFTFKGNLNVDTTAWATNLIKINSVTLNADNSQDWDADKAATNNFSVTKLVANAYPTISAKTSSDDLILTISNPKDSEDDIVVRGLGLNGKVVTASLNEKLLTVAGGVIDWSNVAESIAPGDSIEFRVQADAGETVQVNSITIDVDKQENLEINSNYTNIGTWTSFKVVSSKDKPATVGVSSVTLNKTSLTLGAGDTYQLEATVSPSNATNKSVAWSIAGDDDKVTVSNSGLITVTAGAVNDAKYTVTAKADGDIKATCTITLSIN